MSHAVPHTERMPDGLYQVKFRYAGEADWRFGTVYDTDAETRKAWKDGILLVEDAVAPKRWEIPISECEIVALDICKDREFEEFVGRKYEAAVETARKSKGLVGKMFSEGVGDGNATYVVTEVKGSQAKIEWRGFCLDRWVARPWGWGGWFPKKMVAEEVRREDGMREIFKPLSGIGV